MLNTMLMILMAPVFVLLCAFAIFKVKQLFISGSMVIVREVENGENVNFHVNLYAFDSEERVFNRLMKFAEVGIRRKGFCFDRYQQILNSENVKKLNRDGA